MGIYGKWAETGDEVGEWELDDRLDEILDCEGTVTVAGMEFYPSDILKECDPVAYRCARNDYHDSLVEDGEIIED